MDGVGLIPFPCWSRVGDVTGDDLGLIAFPCCCCWERALLVTIRMRAAVCKKLFMFMFVVACCFGFYEQTVFSSCYYRWLAMQDQIGEGYRFRRVIFPIKFPSIFHTTAPCCICLCIATAVGGVGLNLVRCHRYHCPPPIHITCTVYLPLFSQDAASWSWCILVYQEGNS